MPLGAAAAAAIGSGLSLLSNVGNFIGQKKENQRNREWAESQYQVQKKDTLDFWNMQNDYNSPTSQMARLREAGLNPNLVYGKGADNTAMAISRPAAPNYQGKAPQMDLGAVGQSLVGTYYDVQMKQAQTDNLKAMNTVYLQDAALKMAQNASLQVKTARDKFDLDMANTLKQNSIEMSAESLRQLKTGIDVMLSRNDREAASNAQSLQEGAARILKIRADTASTEADRNRILAQIQNIKSDTLLKQLDANLKREGIQPSDPLWMRVLGQYLDGKGLRGGAEKLKTTLNGVSNGLGSDILNPLLSKPGAWRRK